MNNTNSNNAKHPCFEICETGDILVDIDDPVCPQCKGGAKTAHGVAWEKPVVHMVAMDIMDNDETEAYKLWNSWKNKSGSTDIHDIDFKKHMNYQPSDAIFDKYGEGVSVKLIQKKGEVCMGKLQRIYNNFEKKWSMVVGFWVKKEKHKQICRCIEEAYLIKFNNPVGGKSPTDREVFFGMGDNAIDPKVFEDLRILVRKAWTFMAENRNDVESGGQGGRTKLKNGYIFDSQKNKKKGKQMEAEIGKLVKKINNSGGILKPRLKLGSENKRLQGGMTNGQFRKWLKSKITDGTARELTHEYLFAPVLYAGDVIQKDPGNEILGCNILGGKRRKYYTRKTKRRKRRRKRRKTHKKRKRKPKKKRTRRRRKRR